MNELRERLWLLLIAVGSWTSPSKATAAASSEIISTLINEQEDLDQTEFIHLTSEIQIEALLTSEQRKSLTKF